MSRRDWRRRDFGPPRWWPEGETWPPLDPMHRWGRRRARFARRAAFVFGALFLSSLIGAATLVSWIAHGLRAPWFRGPEWTVAVVVLFGAMAWAFVAAIRRVGPPLADVVTAAQRIAEGDFNVALPVSGPPPLRAVAAAINDMAGRLARQEEQRRALMADIAHELRTPLSIAQGRLEGMIDGVYPVDAAHLEPLLDDTRVLARLVEDLRTLANAESGALTLEREPTDVGMLVHDAANAVIEEARQRGTTIDVNERSPLPIVSVDPVRLRQVVVNLVANAVRHGGDHGRVSVDVSVADGALAVSVTDAGPGMTADEVAKVFDRFYKGRTSTGSGLGLTIARRLVQAHGGGITVTSRPGGTTFVVTIPSVSQS